MRPLFPSPLPGQRQDNGLLAVLCVCGGVAFAALLDAAVKWLSGDYPLHQLLVLRCLVAVPVLYAAAGVHGGREIFLLHPRWPAILLRGLVMFSAYVSFAMAIAAMPIADAV